MKSVVKDGLCALLLGAILLSACLTDRKQKTDEDVTLESEIGTSRRESVSASTHLGVLAMYPASGSSEPDVAVKFKTRYRNLNGAGLITTMSLWLDTTRPAAKRAFASVHGQVRRVTNEQGQAEFRYFGLRYNGGTFDCGTGPRDSQHCPQNFSWDVGNFALGDESWIYFNHDENYADTAFVTRPGVNTIGRYRAVTVTLVDDKTLEVEWEVVFGPYFKHKELRAYTSLEDTAGASLFQSNRPYWHEVGTWSISVPAAGAPDDLGFEAAELPGWTRHGRDGSITETNQRAYLGTTSAQLTSNGTNGGWQTLDYDLKAPRTGRVTAYFYDDGLPRSAGISQVVVTDKPVGEWNADDVHTLAISIRPHDPANPNALGNYHYRARTEMTATGNAIVDGDNDWIDSKIHRTVGWHKVVFWITPIGAWAELDDDERQIYPFNLSSGAAELYGTNKEKRRLHLDHEMTNFQYVRLHVRDGGSLIVDGVRIDDLPAPLDITTASGESAWNLRWDQIFLDAYEEIGLRDHLTDWTAHAINYRTGWWWLLLSDLMKAHYNRYRELGLPFDREQGNRIWTHLLEHYDRWDDSVAGTTHAFTAGNTYAKAVNEGWNAMTPEIQSLTWRRLAVYFDWVSGSSFPTTDAHIGDSSGEDYAFGPGWGPLAGSLLFSDYVNSARWQRKSRASAMRTFSWNPGELCADCEDGVVGRQTIYAPDVDLQDCPLPTDPDLLPTCLCRGDRGFLGDNHDFSYLFDNHAYHPNPNYAFGTLSGLLGAIRILWASGQTVPEAYFHNLSEVWYRHRDFVDYQRGLYRPQGIYRIRPKDWCDGRAPEFPLPSDTAFETGAYWSNRPAEGPNFFRSLRLALALREDYSGTFIGDLDLLDHSHKVHYWQRFDRIGRSVPHNVLFQESDFESANNSESALYQANRQNSRSQYELTRTPLRVHYCEENLVKDTAASVACDTSITHGTHGAIRVSVASTDVSNAEAYSTLIPVEPSTNYVVAYWVKTEDVLPPARGATTGQLLVAQYDDSAEETHGAAVHLIDPGTARAANVTGTTDWIYQSYSFTTEPNAAYVRMRGVLALNAVPTGTVWFDEVQLAPIGPQCGDGVCETSEDCPQDCGCAPKQILCCTTCVPVEQGCPDDLCPQ